MLPSSISALTPDFSSQQPPIWLPRTPTPSTPFALHTSQSHDFQLAMPILSLPSWAFCVLLTCILMLLLLIYWLAGDWIGDFLLDCDRVQDLDLFVVGYQLFSQSLHQIKFFFIILKMNAGP